MALDLIWLDVNLVVFTKTKCVFTLKGLTKNHKKGQKTPELDFDCFQEDINLCPIKSSYEYFELTKPYSLQDL